MIERPRNETCGLCGRVGRMYGRWNDVPLCHGDDYTHHADRRPTCYERWTVYGVRAGDLGNQMTMRERVLTSPDGNSQLRVKVDIETGTIVEIELHDDDGIRIVNYEEAMCIIQSRGVKQ